MRENIARFALSASTFVATLLVLSICVRIFYGVLAPHAFEDVRCQVRMDSGRSHANLIFADGQDAVSRVRLAISAAATGSGDSLGEDLDDELKKRMSSVSDDHMLVRNTRFV
jgi:hypothetical protein